MTFVDRLLRQQGEGLTSLDELAKQVGSDLAKFAIDQGAVMVRLLRKTANAARLPRSAHSYLFWVLDSTKNWPALAPNKKEALIRAVGLIEAGDSMPNLSQAFSVPAEQDELRVEAVIEAAATWAAGPLRAALLREYMSILDKKKDVAVKVLNISPDEARATLEAAFLIALRRQPRWFQEHPTLAWALRPFLG